MIIEYDPDYGRDLSDNQCKLIARKIAEKPYMQKFDVTKSFSNENVIHEIILQMLWGNINRDHVKISIDYVEYEVDDLGYLVDAPDLNRAKLSKDIMEARLKIMARDKDEPRLREILPNV